MASLVRVGGRPEGRAANDIVHWRRPKETAANADKHGLPLEVVEPNDAQRSFVLLPRRWVVQRSFTRAIRLRRLVRDDERLPQTVRDLHFIAFACLMLGKAIVCRFAGVRSRTRRVQRVLEDAAAGLDVVALAPLDRLLHHTQTQKIDFGDVLRVMAPDALAWRTPDSNPRDDLSPR